MSHAKFPARPLGGHRQQRRGDIDQVQVCVDDTDRDRALKRWPSSNSSPPERLQFTIKTFYLFIFFFFSHTVRRHASLEREHMTQSCGRGSSCKNSESLKQHRLNQLIGQERQKAASQAGQSHSAQRSSSTHGAAHSAQRAQMCHRHRLDNLQDDAGRGGWVGGWGPCIVVVQRSFRPEKWTPITWMLVAEV